MNGIGDLVLRRLGMADVALQAVGLLMATHPDGKRFAEVLLQSCDAWVTRLDVPQTPEANSFQQGYLEAISGLRQVAEEIRSRPPAE